MKQFFRLFGYELKYAFLGIKRHLMLCLSAISAISLTLLLVSSILVLGMHMDYFSTDVKQDLSIHVVLDEAITSEDQLDSLQDQISKLKNVKKVTLSNKDEELELMIKEKGEAFALYRGEDNPLSNAFFVYVKNADQIQKTSKQIEKIDGVSSVAYGGNSVTGLVDMLNLIQKIGLGVVVLLIILSFYLIYNTIRTTIDSRRDEIIIMRTVGATNAFVSLPFTIEGIIIGLLGAILPCLVLHFGYGALYNVLDGQLFTPLFPLFTLHHLEWTIGISTMGIGMLIGMLASSSAVRRYLKMKR